MKFLIPLLGKTREAYLEDGIRDYAGRLRRYAALEIGIDARVFPSECPWGLGDVLNEQWLPE